MDENNNEVEEESFSQFRTDADLSTLPKACIVYILALTSPCNVCRMWAMTQWLLPAMESDALWLRFLPNDYLQILARSVESSSWRDFSSTKEHFFSLCDSSLLIDEGKKVKFTCRRNFWLIIVCLFTNMTYLNLAVEIYNLYIIKIINYYNKNIIVNKLLKSSNCYKI